MSKKHRILVVDDEESITFLLKTELDDLAEYDTDTALNGADALNLLQSHVYDVVLLDIKMPRLTGIEVLKQVKELSPSTQVIMLTNLIDVKTAIETTKLGAYDYVSKPYDIDQLMATVRRAIEHRQLVITKEVNQISQSTELVGESPVFRAAMQNAIKLAASDAFVMIQGASGTGKELFAKLIHRNSSRRDQPFIAVNCAAMPDQLLESELFGHEKGSFTSADKTKQGLVEVASGGTLFLDEVGDISPMVQPKLLRFLETGEFRRVGGTSNRTVDVRVISATNKDIQAEVDANRFRADLLFRLNVVNLRLPTLKERIEDIPLLVDAFLSKKTKAKRINDAAMQALMRYHWPGNVRELKHIIEGAIAVSQSEMIGPQDLWMNGALPAAAVSAPSPASADIPAGPLSLEELEQIHIQRTLSAMGWNRAKTASALGITPKTLYLKIKRYKIRVPESS
jgi:two-component system response regulator AtoC